MNSVLTRPKSLQELYRTYFSFANKFEFTSLLRNYIQNDQWRETSQENIWNVLGKIADDIGAVLTDDIINYTRNVVDINTCKIPQMIEHAKMLSYNLGSIETSYNQMPKRIQGLIDIFSINSEYLLGNQQNHILSDEVVKEILLYIRENSSDKSAFIDNDVVDKLIDDPHSLTNIVLYKNFIQTLFYQFIVSALTTTYSNEDPQPIAFNTLFDERLNQDKIISKIDTYKSWVDRYISNEIEHPLNDSTFPNTIFSKVELIRSQKQISTRFNPYKIADNIYFNGMNPTHGLSQDELDLVEMVIDFHSKPKYDYETQQFSDTSTYTQYAYYKELEWCEYVKLVMLISNNIKSFDMHGLTYDIASNKFIRTIGDDSDSSNCLKVVQIFHQDNAIVKTMDGEVALDRNLILRVAKFLCDYVFYIQGIRENIKTIAHKHAMRGSGALLVHIVNDYLIKELPVVRDSIYENMQNDGVPDIKFGWEVDNRFLNYGNVKVLEYEDDNEYFNIDPVADVSYTDSTNERYWEQLAQMGDSDSIGVFTKEQIKNFYKDTLGMGKLQPNQSKQYDDVCDFLVSLFRIGANPITYNLEDKEMVNPIDDIFNLSEEDFGYTKQERVEVQNNTELRRNQEKQFLQYSGNEDIIGESIYGLQTNGVFYWKNTEYSSHALHPFMYNLKLWNKLNNILINGYTDYVNNDMIDYLSSKVRFDQLFGEYGESKNFWKYNIMDLTGYTTRYESAIKDEHIEDRNRFISPLTGYDGLFYPDAAREFIELLHDETNFNIDEKFFKHEYEIERDFQNSPFMKAIYSVYWQENGDNYDTFYTKWYSHLNYPRTDYQKIAMQLWYWRDRLDELITTDYPITKYCLDIQSNSLILVETFKEDETEVNVPLLTDIAIAQNLVAGDVLDDGSALDDFRNLNRSVSSCDNPLKKPNELWIRWKSNPLALPAFDVYYDKFTGCDAFDKLYRDDVNIEFGQMTHTNSTCNDGYKQVINDWRNKYERYYESNNRLPVFFDLEQSANIIIMASWKMTLDPRHTVDELGNRRYITNCSKNPYHILSIERIGSSISEYTFEKYGDNKLLNGGYANPGRTYDRERYHSCSQSWIFDSYHYCPANGSILVPFYAFECYDNDGIYQHLLLNMFVINAQELKKGNYSITETISQIPEQDVDLNQYIPILESSKKYRFDHLMKVCRNTNVVFSVYEESGFNKVKCAFLGQFVLEQDLESTIDQYSPYRTSFKVSSCDAKTRYEFDSQTTEDLSLVKGGYFKDNDNNTRSVYIDERINKTCFNSYDSNDKYVMVIEFEPSIDDSNLFSLSSTSGMRTYTYNILCDAGYIPHFAYQSLVKYDDKEGGTAYTWKNQYLRNKTHMQFELLGIDDKDVEKTYEFMNKMIVDDITDDCSTILNPAKMMDDIYRVWCESLPYTNITDKYNKKYHKYFANEYIDYTNPEFKFEQNGDEFIYDWNIGVDDNGIVDESSLFEIELPSSFEGGAYDAFRQMFDEYYVSVLRTENGDIQNQKRYILPPTQISQFFLGLGTTNDFRECNLNKYATARVQNNKFVSSQVLFVGTPNPFNYDNDGERDYSLAEELQYGNGICGVDSIQLKIDIHETSNGRKLLKPTVRFIKKNISDNPSLIDMINFDEQIIGSGKVMLIFSHRNLDNIAKYHMLNWSSNLYFNGSLPKNGLNQFKYSDFKFANTYELEQIESDGKQMWQGVQEGVDDKGNPYKEIVIQFTLDDVTSDCIDDELGILPPYKYVDEKNQVWYLEQESISDGHVDQDDKVVALNNRLNKSFSVYNVPKPGHFKWAHLVKSKPEKYLDYLYVKKGTMSFKISEESHSLADAMSQIPPFYIDEVLKNKLEDLNDVQVLHEMSTFIHQSEEPTRVQKCGTFNPLLVDSVLKYGVEQRDEHGEDNMNVICVDNKGLHGKIIELDNYTGQTRLQLQLDDGEVDDCLKIYTNYVRKDLPNGDFYYDLYFNIQNLFNSPFEYISKVTNQPNTLILKDSYLYLSGDKFKRDTEHMSGFEYLIDEDKMSKIRQGGELTIYGQVKVYSDDRLSDVRTIKLFSYKVYNISDDKPKFLIDKVYDITDSTLKTNIRNNIKISFADVMWTVDERQFVQSDIDNKFKQLKDDIYIVQPVHIDYNWCGEDDSRVNSVKFDIANDIIDFGVIPEVCVPWKQHTSLKNRKITSTHPVVTSYYDRWSDKYMSIKKNPDTDRWQVTLNYDYDCGFNFETIYLRWKIPANFRLMDTLDRLGGYAFSSTADNVYVETNDIMTTTDVEINKGYIVTRVLEPGTMYLGLEHSTKKRMNGFVINGLADAIKDAINHAMPEKTIKEKAQKAQSL